MQNNPTDEAVGFTTHDEKTGDVEKKDERRTSQEARSH